MAYRVVARPVARRGLRALEGRLRRQVAAAIEALGEAPRPHGCVKLAGRESEWRIRVRSVRVVYSIDDEAQVVTVLVVGQRGDVYKR
jgi:mRNA interferase RelE/StbE